MNDNVDRAKKWTDFIILNSQFPHPEKLKQHLSNADFLDFCDCGCNSFAVKHRNELTQSTLVNAGLSGLFFEAAFQTVENDKTVEIMLFSDEHGYLNYVEIDCCGNSQPVPSDIELHPTPFHVYVSKSVASD
jgi:hypothetical protein